MAPFHNESVGMELVNMLNAGIYYTFQLSAVFSDNYNMEKRLQSAHLCILWYALPEYENSKMSFRRRLKNGDTFVSGDTHLVPPTCDGPQHFRHFPAS